MNPSRYTSIKAVVALIGSSLAVMALFVSCQGGGGQGEDFYSKNLTLPVLTNAGERVSLSSFKGKPLVVNFWASWCVPCRDEMPNLEQSWKKWKSKGVEFVGINVLDNREGAMTFLKQTKVTFPNLYDPDGKAARAYNVAVLPVTFFIDRRGRITRKNFGGFVGPTGLREIDDGIKGIVE